MRLGSVKRKPQPLFHTRSAPAVAEETRFLTFELDRAKVDKAARTVPLSFSSELPVDRWFGTEILDHSPRSVRMGRLNNGGPLLLDHDRNMQIGVVESAAIDKDKKGRAVVRFSKSARADEIFQDVLDGIRRLVSVGYRIHKTETKQEAGGVESVRVVDWEPFEISIVSIPADESVGVGRSGNNPSAHTSNNLSQNTSMNREQMMAALRAAGIQFDDRASDETLRSLLPAGTTAPAPAQEQNPATPPAATQRAADPAPAPAPSQRAQVNAPTPVQSAGPSAEQAIAAERRRVADIEALADQVRANGVTIDHRRAIADGVPAEAFQRAAFEALLARQTAYAPGGSGDGLSRRESRDLSQFSIVRGIRSIMNNGGLDGLEREMHQEAIREAQRSGINLEGNFHIPAMVLNHGRRDMTATGGTDGSEGGASISTQLGSFIDLLYARLVLRGLGAQVLTGLQGNIALPKLVNGSTPMNLAENAPAPESNPTMDQIALTPHRASTFVEVSQQLMIQSSTDIEAMVRNDLLTSLALMFEARAINGTGIGNQPLGILNTTGIGSVAGGANGAAPTWAQMVALETAVASSNADVGTLGYLTNVNVRGKLKTTSVVEGQNGFIWSVGDTPINGHRVAVTTQVPNNLTKGTSAGVASAIIFGNFADLILAQWGGISVMANPYSRDTEGLIRLTINAYHDNAVRRPESFAAITDALTA